MRQVACNNCGLVTEFLTSVWNAQGSTCKNCGNVIQPLLGNKIAPASCGNRIELSHIKGKGMGVLATQDIKDGELIERCPVFVIGSETGTTKSHTKSLIMSPYEDGGREVGMSFMLLPWVTDGNRCMAAGYAMMYNHAPVEKANILYYPHVDPDSSRRFLDFYAKKDIKAGEELTQTYAPSNSLWFTARG